MRLRRLAARLRGDERGLALLEFALTLPMMVALLMGGLEIGNFALAALKAQRLATMTADLVAQSGVDSVGASEPQIYDLFSAIDVAAKPFDMRNHGRVVITAIKGTDSTPSDATDAADRNSLMWQRFDGGYTAAPLKIGCRTSTTVVTLPGNRQLVLNELMFHVQVSYQYQPLMIRLPASVHLPGTITRTATFRARSTDFQAPTPATGYPPKQNCTTANGL